MPVLVGLQEIRPASRFVSWDTDASPQSGTFHTRDRWQQVYQDIQPRNKKQNKYDYVILRWTIQ